LPFHLVVRARAGLKKKKPKQKTLNVEHKPLFLPLPFITPSVAALDFTT